MITVNTGYTDIIATGNYYYEWRVKLGSTSTYITKDNIVTGTISYSLFEQYSIGNTIAAELNLTIRGITVDPSKSLEVQWRVCGASSNSSWYTKGTFYIDTLKTSPYSDITEITAFDAMLKAEQDFAPNGSYVPDTAKNIATKIAGDMGLTLGTYVSAMSTTTLTNAPNVGVGGTTDRQMLSYLGVMFGGSWKITSDNKLAFDGMLNNAHSQDTLDLGDGVNNIEVSAAEPITRIKLWLDNETYYLAPTGYTEEQWKALGGRCVEAKLPFYATQTVANNLYTHLSPYSVTPFRATGAYIDPRFELWDDITIKNTTSRIGAQTITLNSLAPSDVELGAEQVQNSLYPYVTPVERNLYYEAHSAQTAAQNAQTAAAGANYREQLIYISKASGTNTVSANTTWVTDATGAQNTWTTVRPVYNSSYPVLFVATQRQSVSQSSGTTCTCTTPAKDQTTTVIDGGHITTGTIDASVVTVSNLNASNITSGTINAIDINGSNITGSTLTSATANGSVRIKDGSIDFFPNATTTGTPFSQIKHTTDSVQGDSIEWTNSGYTKLVNTGGGQWTADFLNFKINSDMQMQIYPDSDGFHTKIMSDFVQMTGDLTVSGAISTGGYAAVANLTAFNNAILTKYGTMSNGQISYLRLAPSASISPFGAYVQFCTICKINSGYGVVEAVSYRDGDGFVRCTASIWNDAVTTWTRESGNHKFAMSSAKAIPLQNNYRGFLVITDSTSGNNGVYIVYTGSTGLVGLVTLHAASNVTLTTSTANQLTITPSSGTRNCLLIDISANATI